MSGLEWYALAVLTVTLTICVIILADMVVTARKALQARKRRAHIRLALLEQIERIDTHLTNLEEADKAGDTATVGPLPAPDYDCTCLTAQERDQFQDALNEIAAIIKDRNTLTEEDLDAIREQLGRRY